tara:strand:- start:17624 stop:17830 length:207 start_codon:yes stop_codon:yes gene_type:complete
MEYKLTRTTYTVEECFVMATDREEAEEKGYLKAQKWKFVADEKDIEAEEIDNVVNLNYEKNIRHEKGK